METDIPEKILLKSGEILQNNEDTDFNKPRILMGDVLRELGSNVEHSMTFNGFSAVSAPLTVK